MRKKSTEDESLVMKSFFYQKLKIALEESEARMDERARQYRDQILTKLDGVMKELEQSRDLKRYRVTMKSELLY